MGEEKDIDSCLTRKYCSLNLLLMSILKTCATRIDFIVFGEIIISVFLIVYRIYNLNIIFAQHPIDFGKYLVKSRGFLV